MIPYHTTESGVLYHGDCLEVMATLPDGCVDLTVTSPPYDNLRTYNGNNTQWGEHVWKAVIAELFRLTKQGGIVVWVVGDATIKGSETGTSFKQALWAMECGFRLYDTMIYEKSGIMPTPNRYCQQFEYMFILSKHKPKSTNLIIDRKNKWAGTSTFSKIITRQRDGSLKIRDKKTIKQLGCRLNIWRYVNGCGFGQSNKMAYKHPATFPEKLAIDHIISWSNEGATVLDCFIGSGTTAIAAERTNRQWIGIEKEQGYCDITVKRLQAEQPGLFSKMRARG